MSLRNIRTVAVVVAAAAVAVVGVLRLVAAPDSSAAAAVTDQGTVDSMVTQVTAAEWTGMDGMDHDGPGYQMPPAMMPGMPEDGDQRLSVSLTVTNTGDTTRPLRPAEEFVLFAGTESGQYPVHTDTFGELPRLPPNNAVKGILYFDLPPENLEPPAWIEWTHGDTAIRLTVPMDGLGDVPSHSHDN